MKKCKEKKLSELFRYKCVMVSRAHCNFEKVVIILKLSPYQMFLVLLNGHLVLCEDRTQTLEVLLGKISSVI